MPSHLTASLVFSRFAPQLWVWRRLRRLLGFVAAGLLAACAQLPQGQIDSRASSWSGRLSLQVQSEPPQSFTAGFELKGSAQQGELRLNSPLGNTLLAARWSPLEAILYAGDTPRSYASIDELIEKSTGAPLPVAALFDWLAGKSTASEGWLPDLRQQRAGRINARRNQPLPPSELRIVLDSPAP